MHLRRIVLAAALAGSLSSFGTACQKQQLTEAVVPDAGVTMRYDLTPGQTYQGHIESQAVAETPAGNVDIRFEYDVELLVTGTMSPDGPLVVATFRNIKANAIMPAGLPPAMAGVDPEVAKSLNGVELRFNLSEAGEIANMPELPEDQPPTVLATLGQLTAGLQAAFARMPDEPLKKGETWTRNRDEDGTSTEMTGTFKDFGSDASGATVATLETENKGSIKSEAQGQQVEGNVSGLSTITFVTSAGFASALERKIRQTSNLANVTLDFDITWTKGDKVAVDTTTPAEVQAVEDPCDPDYVGGEACEGAEQQAITDPCDPDYVGGEDCEEDASAAEAAPETEK